MNKIKLLLAVFSFAGIGLVNAQYSDIHDFKDTGVAKNSNGARPYGSVIVVGNVMYGVTSSGGSSAFGNIFSIHTDGTHYKDLFDFTGLNGKTPDGTLILVGRKLYGFTYIGGLNASGNIFSIDTNGAAYTDIHDFAGADGYWPYFGGLTLSGSMLYGSTANGGANGYGNIFAFDTNGTGFTDIYDFNVPTGAYAYGQVSISGGKIFGMTNQGGVSNLGNIYSVDINGKNYKDLMDFNGTTGSLPQEGEFAVSGTKMFGMAYHGGKYGFGDVFSIDTNGKNFKDIYDFKDSIGENPYGSLTRSGNWLYGMTSAGGASGNGEIFVIDTNGTGFADIHDFNGAAGATPYGDVTISKGVLYGMTNLGGKNAAGVIFSDGICGAFSTSIADTSLSCFEMNTGSIWAFASGGPTPYMYAWTGGKTSAQITGLSAGTYTVSISDQNGCTHTASVTLTQPTGMTFTVHSTPDTVGCNGTASVTVMTGGKAPFTYLWSVIGKTTDTVKNLCSGGYCCTVTDNNGCAQTVCDTVGFYDAGINNINAGSSNLLVYPNPSNGVFTIGMKSHDVGMKNIEVYNILGEKVYSINSTLSAPVSVNLNEPNGVYLYRVVTLTGKLIGEGKITIQK